MKNYNLCGTVNDFLRRSKKDLFFSGMSRISVFQELTNLIQRVSNEPGIYSPVAQQFRGVGIEQPDGSNTCGIVAFLVVLAYLDLDRLVNWAITLAESGRILEFSSYYANPNLAPEASIMQALVIYIRFALNYTGYAPLPFGPSCSLTRTWELWRGVTTPKNLVYLLKQMRFVNIEENIILPTIGQWFPSISQFCFQIYSELHTSLSPAASLQQIIAKRQQMQIRKWGCIMLVSPQWCYDKIYEQFKDYWSTAESRESILRECPNATSYREKREIEEVKVFGVPIQHYIVVTKIETCDPNCLFLEFETLGFRICTNTTIEEFLPHYYGAICCAVQIVFP